MNCISCTSTSLGEFTRGEVRLYRCNICDLVFNKDIPDQQTQEEYYAHDYQLSASAVGLNELRRMSRWSENVRLVRELGSPNGSKRLLDVGCDRGFFLDEARRWGWDVRGVEPSVHARDYAMRIGLRVEPSLAELHDNNLTAVTMWHVLEHISDPVNVLKQLRGMMADDAAIHIRVPDFASWSSRLLGSSWIWFQPHNHVVHYSVKSLRRVLEEAGFKPRIVRSQRPNSLHTLLEFYTTNRALKRAGAPTASLRSWASTLVQYLSGVELYAVATKQ